MLDLHHLVVAFCWTGLVIGISAPLAGVLGLAIEWVQGHRRIRR